MVKFLITGGAGLIGSQIARELTENKHEVILYDSFINYKSPLETRYQLYLEKRFEGIRDKVVFERGDTRDKDHTRRVLMKHKPEIIIHLAALPLADLSDTHTEEATSTILQATINILEVLRETDFVKRFIYTSSSMVYGDFQYAPADENHPKNPKDIYGGMKLAGEIITESFCRRYKIPFTIIRPSAVYGPTDVNRRVSQIFIENAMKGKELILHDGGEAKLDFTYVKDIAHGFVLAALSNEAVNEIFNITTGKARSLKEFAEILKQHFPDLKIKEEPQKDGFIRPKRGTLAISKAKDLLGYEPQYNIEKGIKEYIEFLKNLS